MASAGIDQSNEAMTSLITKEIELTMNNTYAVRMKFIFTAWIGPFLLLGALIVAAKGKVEVSTNVWTWVFSGLASAF